jgi:predicted PolB exonuclease-like 3'-5' exonuclease
LDIIVFDIETIPQQSELSKVQETYLDKQLVKRLGPDYQDNPEYNETKRLIMGTTPYLGEICCIGIKKVLANGQFDMVALKGAEADILTRWWGIISKHRGQFVHYNGLGFDVPWIIKRSMKYGIRPTSKDFLDRRRFQKYPHFDVQQILADWDRFNIISLELACDFLGVTSPKEGEIKAKDVAQAFKDGKIKQIAEYCLKDVDATHQIYQLVTSYTKI